MDGTKDERLNKREEQFCYNRPINPWYPFHMRSF